MKRPILVAAALAAVVILVGYSFGGNLALRMSKLHLALPPTSELGGFSKIAQRSDRTDLSVQRTMASAVLVAERDADGLEIEVRLTAFRSPAEAQANLDGRKGSGTGRLKREAASGRHIGDATYSSHGDDGGAVRGYVLLVRKGELVVELRIGQNRSARVVKRPDEIRITPSDVRFAEDLVQACIRRWQSL